MIQRRTALLGLAAASLASPALAKGKAGFKTIFDGKSLDGWTHIGDANWTLKDGVATADKGRGMLVSTASYKDFDLRAEVWVSPEANSGIFIRCSDRATVTQNNAYEVNIYDTRPDPAYGTGAIVDVAKVSPMPKAGGRWNVVEISAHGDVLSVVFNGQKTVDAVRNNLYAEGPIALQYGAGMVKFRRVDIRTACAQRRRHSVQSWGYLL